MPDTTLLKPSALADEMRAHTGLFTNKTFDWDAFPASRGFPVLLQITVGSGTPEMPVHVCHPKNKDLELSRRFGAPGPDKIQLFSPESSDRRHQELARHVVRYRDRTPVWDKAGFARLAYVGDGGAPAHGYRMDMIHLPKGVAVRPYVRDVEDV